MTPPGESTALEYSSHSAGSHTDHLHADVQRIRWAGWLIAGSVVLGWSGWLSLTVIRNQSTLERLMERQELQHSQLSDTLEDVKQAIRRL